MQASRILPDLQCSVLCEDVRQEANGNFIALGIIGVIRVPKMPIVAGKLSVFTRWVAGVGEFHENIRLIAPDQETVVQKCEAKFVLRDPAHHAKNIAVIAGKITPNPGGVGPMTIAMLMRNTIRAAEQQTDEGAR